MESVPAPRAGAACEIVPRWGAACWFLQRAGAIRVGQTNAHWPGLSSCRRWLQDDGWNFLLLYQIVVGLDVGGDDGLPLLEMLVDGLAEYVEYVVALLGGHGIGAGDHAGKGDEVIVQADGKIENVLSTFSFGLDEG